MPGNFRARPTTDMAKESLFNILANQLNFEGLHVLDLFSGTGGIGFEFASRGANHVVSVEKNYVHYKHIVKSVEMLKCTSIKTIKSDAFMYVRSCKEKFDVVFADPPYDLKKLEDIPITILKGDILSKNGLFILEHPETYQFNEWPEFVDMRKYGSVHFTFFRKG